MLLVVVCILVNGGRRYLQYFYGALCSSKDLDHDGRGSDFCRIILLHWICTACGRIVSSGNAGGIFCDRATSSILVQHVR